MERALLIIWGIWLLLIFIAALRVFAYLIARRSQDRRWANARKDSSTQMEAVVIVPVKGFDPQATPPFFDTLFSQNYSSYRVIVAFESWEAPEAQWLCEELEISDENPIWKHPSKDSPLRQIVLACGGLAEDEGQKICNQRAAFQHIDDEDVIIAFADADISLDQDWLASLTAPINFGSHKLSTTYRWLVPKRPNLPSQLASVINGSITTQGGWEITNVLWGGSMAIHRGVFYSIKVPELIEGSLNDDLRISKVARKAGNKIAFVRSLVLPTMIDFDNKAFFEFAKRQYTQVKFFSPILYFGTNLLLGFYALGLATIVAALVYGVFFAWVPLAMAYVIDQFRGLARQQVYLSLFAQNGIRKKLSATCWLEQMLTPLWMILHWLIVVSTWTQRRIQWGGIRYKIISSSKTKILDRSVSYDPLPVGVPGLGMIAALHDLPRAPHTAPLRPIQTATSLRIGASEDDIIAASEGVSSNIATESKSVPAESLLPMEPAPKLSHPGVSIYVTPLRETAISFKRTPPLSSSSSSSILFRNGKVLRGIEAHTRILPAKRYPVPVVPVSPPVPLKKCASRTLPVITRNLPASQARLMAQTGSGAHLAGISKQEKDPSKAKIHGMSRLALALSHSADIPPVHFPTNPSLASSSRPSGLQPPRADQDRETKPQSVSPSSPAPASVSSSPGAGFIPGSGAARRATRMARDTGSLPLRSSRSGRTNLASPKRRGLGRNRPVSRGASGRLV